MVLWSLLVDKVHRNPTTGIDWDRPAAAARGRSTSASSRSPACGDLGGIGGLYCVGRWYWEGGYLFSMEVLGLGRADARPFHPLCAVARPAADRARDGAWHFGQLLIGRSELVDREELLPFLPRLGGQGLLPRLHDRHRARATGPERSAPARRDRYSQPVELALADHLHVHDRRRLRDRRLRADDEAARRPYPKRQPLCGGLDRGPDLLSALRPDGRGRAARLSSGHAGETAGPIGSTAIRWSWP
jgi:hypothetical protein